MSDINFDRAKVERLRTALGTATTNGQEQFVFEGHELLVAYARYLVQYLDTQLKP